MAEPVSELVGPDPVAVGWRRFLSRGFWRRVFTDGLTPRSIGLALGLGAAVGVAPLPGLQMATVGALCWRLRLNFPISLMASNISLGPLLVMWAAVSASIGRWLRLGILPWRSYASFVADFHEAAPGVRGFLAAVGTCLGDWLLGSLLLMPLIGGAVGFAGYAVASAICAARRRRRERADA